MVPALLTTRLHDQKITIREGQTGLVIHLMAVAQLKIAIGSQRQGCDG